MELKVLNKQGKATAKKVKLNAEVLVLNQMTMLST